MPVVYSVLCTSAIKTNNSSEVDKGWFTSDLHITHIIIRINSRYHHLAKTVPRKELCVSQRCIQQRYWIKESKQKTPPVMMTNLFAELETFEFVDAVEDHLHQRLHLLHVSQAVGRPRPINNWWPQIHHTFTQLRLRCIYVPWVRIRLWSMPYESSDIRCS